MLSKLIPLCLIAASAWAGVVTDVQTALGQNNLSLADAVLQRYRAAQGITPEWIEALSWMGRGALGLHQAAKADTYAKEAERLAVDQLKSRRLDAEPHLPIALGASIEVQSQVLEQRDGRAEAVAYLRSELAKYQSTSIRARIQKNINLLSLTGKLAPALEEHEFLGAKPQPLTSLKNSPVILFFWAHWCGDCKDESAILAQVAREYAAKGLKVIAPTQRYGYVARGEEAGPADELKYIDQVRHQYYSELVNMPAPISEENFKRYGASTTPTLVLIDKQGIVRLYHPGKMTLDELRAALNKLG